MATSGRSHVCLAQEPFLLFPSVNLCAGAGGEREYRPPNFSPGRLRGFFMGESLHCLPRSNPNGHAYEHWASARRAHRRTGGLGTKPSPPARAGRQLTVQSRGFFTSRYGKGAQLQSLDDERVAALAFTLKVRPVTGRTDFQALLFHFNPGKLAFELRNARVQIIDVGPVTTW